VRCGKDVGVGILGCNTVRTCKNLSTFKRECCLHPKGVEELEASWINTNNLMSQCMWLNSTPNCIIAVLNGTNIFAV
jgi:hypothetical protein